MRRKVTLVILGVVAGVALAGGALAAVVLATAPGHDALRRWAVERLGGVVDGTVRIGSVRGSLWRAADLREIVFAAPDGTPVIRAERLRATFALTDLARGRFRFGDVTLVRPVVVLEQDTAGHWNVERLFRLLEPDTTPPGARPLVDLRGVTIVDGTLVVRQRPARAPPVERTFTGLDLTLRRLRASHPDSTALVAAVERLKVTVRNPDLDVLGGSGEVTLDGGDLRFALQRVTLPGSQFDVTGQARLDGAHPVYDVSLEAPRLAFADVRAFAPALPRAGAARLTARARGLDDGAAEVDLGRLDLRSGRSVVRGQVRLVVGARGGVSVRDMDLALAPLDLALVAPFVDTLPARGLVQGRLRGEGSTADLALTADLRWSDEGVGPSAANALTGSGRLRLGGADGVGFRGFRVASSEFDLRTIRRFAPSLPLTGRLRLAGVLDGPARAVRFSGTLQHLGPPGEASAARGTIAVTAGDSASVVADLALDSLSLDLLHRAWPAIPAAGVLAGRVRLNGPLTGLNVDARLAGRAGGLAAIGRVGMAETLTTVMLEGTFDSLDLNRFAPDAPPSALTGAWTLALALPADSARPATGLARLALRPGRVAGVPVYRGGLLARLEDAFIAVDSFRLESPGGVATASGSFGRGPGPAGQASFALRSDTLGYLEPLVRWFRRASGDSSAVRLDGAGSLVGRVSGTVAAWSVRGSLALGAAQVAGTYVRGLRVAGGAARAAAGISLDLDGSADSLALGGLGYAPVGLRLAGPLDSLGAAVSAGFARTSAVQLRASIWGDSVMRVVNIDSLQLVLPVRTWHLARPAGMALTADVMVFDTVELRPDSGRGRIYADGLLPRGGVGDFRLAVESLAVADLFTLIARDTTGVGGTIDVTVHVAGPAATPSMELALVLIDGRFGDYRAPLIQVLARYSERLLTMKGGLWRDTVRVIALNGALPVDLALETVAERKLPGPISVVARSDSAALSLFNPLITVVRDLAGDVSLDMTVGGTWADPRLTGHADIRDGAMTVPALGARYRGMDARLELRGDSIIVTRGHLLGGQGALDVTGHAVLAGGGPRLDLALRASRFLAFDMRDFGRLTGTGDLRLAGPFYGATLRGRLVVDAGYLKFADLVQKRVVSLDDPEFRAIVDSNLARAQDLGPDVRTVFLDSLRIDSLAIVMGPDVWLRSSEANIQLSGDFTIDKTIERGLPRYRMDGALQAVRGTYRLILGPQSLPGLTKDFRVQRGTVRFYGTPDFNPDMDIVAEHTLRTLQNQPMVVRALIGGTLLYPRLRLESDSRPPLSETEIVSYLLTGAPPSAGTGALGQAGLAGVLSGVAGEVGQSLIGELGLPLDYITVQAGATSARGPGRSASALTNARIGAGAQLGARTFLSVTAGLCEVVSARTLPGASIEYRLSQPWSLSAAFEPLVPECGSANALSGLAARYQFSFDLFWQQGFR